MLGEERAHLGRLSGRASLQPLREDRKVARDGFVSWGDPATESTGSGRERLSNYLKKRCGDDGGTR